MVERTTGDCGEASPRICIFTPTPLMTVTIEDSHGDPEVHLHSGGQGFWVARLAANLGATVTMCCALGGEAGEFLAGMIERAGLHLAAVPCSGASPAYVDDRRDGERTPIARTPGPRLTRHEVDELYNVTIAEALTCDVAVLTGQNGYNSVVPELYGRLSRDLRSNGVRTVADLSGDELAKLDGGYLLKVSHEDLARDGEVATTDVRELVAAMEDLAQSRAQNIVVSRAGEPAIALMEGRLLEVLPPRFEAVDHRGAGDSMTAGLAVALAGGQSLEEALQLAAAAGALNVTRHGLGSGHGDSIRKLAPTVVVRPLNLP